MPSMTGRRIAVLGATGAIGGAITRALLAGGAEVVATGRSKSRLDDLRDAGAITVTIDFALDGSTELLRKQCALSFTGALDGLAICTGAHGPIGPTRDLDGAVVSNYLAEHLVAPLAAINAVAPMLDAGSHPSIVVMSGGGATAARPRYSAYAMAKVGLVRLVENIAAEEPKWRINAVAPGFIASAIHETSIAAGVARSGEDPGQLRAQLAAADDPSRVAALVAFLLSGSPSVPSGRLLSAPWDRWDNEAWLARVASSPDLGRIRRIDEQQFGPVSATD